MRPQIAGNKFLIGGNVCPLVLKHQKCFCGLNFMFPVKKGFQTLLRLQLVIVVAFNVVQVAGLVIDCLKGSHAAAREGVCEKVLTQNGP